MRLSCCFSLKKHQLFIILRCIAGILFSDQQFNGSERVAWKATPSVRVRAKTVGNTILTHDTPSASLRSAAPSKREPRRLRRSGCLVGDTYRYGNTHGQIPFQHSTLPQPRFAQQLPQRGSQGGFAARVTCWLSMRILEMSSRGTVNCCSC